MKYGGFWIRFLASMIDALILSIVIIIILWWCYGPQAMLSMDAKLISTLNSQLNLSIAVQTSPVTVPFWVRITLNWIMPILLTLLFWRFRSATPGKMICQLKIVNAEDFKQPSTKQFIIRFFGYFVSTIPLCLGFLWIAFDKRKQGWHDKIAKTFVIWSQ